MQQHQTVLILDFGSQYTQLIARRVRECGVYSEIHAADYPLSAIEAQQPIGIILSGGPSSVYEDGAPRSEPGLLELGVPVLGICYGMQLLAMHAGGEVESSSEREYGRAEIHLTGPGALLAGTDTQQPVWMSHGDKVVAMPQDFVVTARSDNSPIVGFESAERRLYGLQFHPEVSHTRFGGQILRSFLFAVCGAEGDWTVRSLREELATGVREQIGDGRVICAVSGGVDSSVLAALLHEAVGDRMQGVFVDTGLLRKGERSQVETSLREGLGIPLETVDAGERFLAALAGVEDPEEKRRRIGHEFIEVFEARAKEHAGAAFLGQGTLYPDVIESTAVKGPSSTIKTHHNVGGLPERLGLELVEPLRRLFKDEVRQLGRELGLPEAMVGRHPFPGPGLAVRILGEVTAERVAVLQEADAIFIGELRAAGLYDQVAQAFAVLLPVRSVGVMGDFRTYEQVAVLRSVDTSDFMTADWSQLPHDFLGRVASRIVNEVRGINRVAYDVTSKPPGTIEWE